MFDQAVRWLIPREITWKLHGMKLLTILDKYIVKTPTAAPTCRCQANKSLLQKLRVIPSSRKSYFPPLFKKSHPLKHNVDQPKKLIIYPRKRGIKNNDDTLFAITYPI